VWNRHSLLVCLRVCVRCVCMRKKENLRECVCVCEKEFERLRVYGHRVCVCVYDVFVCDVFVCDVFVCVC